jgi:hypothetical protein
MPTMITIIGQAATHAGLVQQRDLAGDPNPFTLRPAGYLREQPVPIPVHFDHDDTWLLGSVDYLERSNDDGLLVVGRIANDDLADVLDDGPWYLSARTRCVPLGTMEYGLARIREVSLVRHPANLRIKPVRWARHDIGTSAGSEPHDMPLRWYDTWHRAHERLSGQRYRKMPEHLVIADIDPLDAFDEVLTDPAGAARHRAAATTAARPKPTPPVRPDSPRVRLHGVWLDEVRSAEVLDQFEAGHGWPAPATG